LLLCLFVVLLCVTVAHKQAAPQPAPPPPPSQAFVPTDTMEGNLPLHGVERAAQRTTDDDEDEADEDAADRRPVRAEPRRRPWQATVRQAVQGSWRNARLSPAARAIGSEAKSSNPP